MGYADRYRFYISSVKGLAEKCALEGKRFALGFTSNLDVLLQWEPELVSRLAEGLVEGVPKIGDITRINTPGDFLGAIYAFAIEGRGGEVDIASSAVSDYVMARFKNSVGVGGTCVQGASALDALGFQTLAHITDRSPGFCKVASGHPFSTVVNGEIRQVGDSAVDMQPLRHFIIQYREGDALSLAGKRYEIPLSNRLILDYDPINKVVPLDPVFLKYCEENAGDIISYCITGFNCLEEQRRSDEFARELAGHFKAVRERNPHAVFVMEDSFYFSRHRKQGVYAYMARSVDYLGMNEEELSDAAADIGMGADGGVESALAVLEAILSRYAFKGLVLHTKDYSLFYGDAPDGADMERGLTLGNAMACTRARTGRYGTVQDLYDSLSLPLSPHGVKCGERLGGMDTKRFACLVPSRYIERPNCTIGLGDTFTAGLHLGFIGARGLQRG